MARLILSCLFALSFWPAVAAAELSPGERARAEYQKGNAAFAAGRFTAARQHYKLALEAESAFDILCNLGRTEAELGDLVPAFEHLSLCIERYPLDAELAESRGRFVELRDEVGGRMTAEQLDLANERIERARAAAVAPSVAEPVVAAEPEVSPAATSEAPADGTSNSLRLPLTLGLGGVGVALAGTGAALLFVAADEASGAAARRDGLSTDPSFCFGSDSQECADLKAANESSDAAHNAGVSLLAAGGALVTGAVLTYFLWPSGKAGSGSVGESKYVLRPSAAYDPLTGLFSARLSGTF